MDINEEWITSHWYFSVSDVVVCRDTRAEFTAVEIYCRDYIIKFSGANKIKIYNNDSLQKYLLV